MFFLSGSLLATNGWLADRPRVQVQQEYWRFGRLEIACVFAGATLSAASSLAFQIAPPWWFLPQPELSQRIAGDVWEIYADRGGYDYHWVQSVIGWSATGAVVGLFASNVLLRGNRWHDDDDHWLDVFDND